MMSYDEWISSLEEKVEKISKIQAAISNFQVLPRLGKLLEDKSQSCPECKIYWQKLQDSTSHLEYFFDDGNRYSADFDNLVQEILKHLKTSHKIKPKGLVLSINTLIGMAIGLLLGVLISMVVAVFPMKSGIVLGWLLGTLIGWFVGKYKEGKLRKEDLIF
ncbi:hypothetical protein [Plebeiibacterium sediminum]|uniref:Glycine zipper family protein n=1 Tax=Plebeiibacterium sediminum TaxID=2992112 RepID=A0AAE3M3S4_9BACT|nr:hypothetical protein [Plebeiobacterium sediminum]MCW3786548.1 hypothetical protein [Plebeiobacterium sediminum]